MTLIKEEIDNAIKTLQEGGVILYPTDTVWGLGCDATNKDAVQKILDIKKSTNKKSMLVLLNNINFINSYVEHPPEVALDIAELSEKPTTIIYPEAKNLAKNLVADDGSIGIRITTEEFTDKLLQKFRKPIVSTSANISGEKFPVNFSEIASYIKSSVDYIVNFNQEKNMTQVPSTIIKVGVGGQIKIIRK